MLFINIYAVIFIALDVKTITNSKNLTTKTKNMN